MNVRKIAIADASFELSPGQNGKVFTGNVIDQRHGGPITIGFGRYEPDQSIAVTLTVDDVMVILEGRLSVSTNAGTVTAIAAIDILNHLLAAFVLEIHINIRHPLAPGV